VLAPILLVLFLSGHASAAWATAMPPPTPPVTANPFLPDQRNLSDCVGALERPGCGSAARGSSSQTAVFIVMFAGMSFIFIRIAIGVRKNRANMGNS
jgi:hypothetical protein